MIKFPLNRIYNSYIIDTSDYDNIKKQILDFIIGCGFDEKMVLTNNHPDVIFLESKDKMFEIASIRNKVIENSIYTPKIAEKKFYIIYDAVNLNENSQNAILKTLEEAKDFDVFMLVTSNINNLLETIKSRCFIIKDNVEIDYKDVLNDELMDETLKSLANIKYESIADKMIFADKFNVIENKDNKGINNKNLKVFIKICRFILRDVLIYKKTLSKNLINIKEKESIIVSIANTLDFEDIGKIIDALDILSEIKNYQIDKKVAVFNFLNVSINKE